LAKILAEIFLRVYYRYHGLPRVIVSDRGSQFVGVFWSRIYKLLKITRRLSTVYYPETDGSIKKINDILEFYLRTYVDLAQTNWSSLLPFAELAINNRDAASTEVNPFFLIYGYHCSPLNVPYEKVEISSGNSLIQKTNALLQKTKKASE